jgi:glycosyltransferase involved in cell wall biosynthesis
MSKKKILVFIDWFTPGFRAGGPISSCVNLIDHLKEEFDFSVITSDTDYMEADPYKDVKSDQWIVRPDGVRIYYFSKQKLTRANMKKLVEKEEFDNVYLNGMFSRNFTLLPLKLFKKKKSKIVLAVRGMLAPSALKIKSAKKRFFLSYAKLSGSYSGVTFQATSPQETKDIAAVFGSGAKVKMAPNLPEKRDRVPNTSRKKEKGSLRLINIARIAPEKNLLYALKVLEKVKEKVFFDFYGPVYDNAYWNECEEQIKKLPSTVNAIHKGVIEPGEVTALLGQYHFMFMPTRGENFGHIIAQSFAAGTPVIISDQTPWRDLAAKGQGYDLSLNDPSAFVKTITESAMLGQSQYDLLSSSTYEQGNSSEGFDKNLKNNRELFQ